MSRRITGACFLLLAVVGFSGPWFVWMGIPALIFLIYGMILLRPGE